MIITLWVFLTVKSDLSHVKSTFDYQIEASILIIIILFLLGLPVADFMQRFVTKPIYELLDFLQGVAEDNSYEKRLEKKTDDEMGVLIDGFNNLLDKIGRRNEAIEKKAQELEKALSDLKKTQSQLVQNSKMASVGELAAGVAHEINNPVAFVNSNTQVLKKYITSLKEIIAGYQKLGEGVDEDSPKSLIDLKASINQLEEKENLEFILEDFDELIEDSIEGLERVTVIVGDLKSFSRVDESEVKEVDVNKSIDATIKNYLEQLKI